MSEQKDTYLEQLKQSADWTGTYLSGVSGRLTVEQVEKIHEIIEKYSTDIVDYELATDDINAALWPNAPTLTSGDGSESAGLRGTSRIPSDLELATLFNFKWCDNTHSNNLEWMRDMIADFRKVVTLAALAPAISRPPTQGSAGQECADCDKLIGERDEMEERVNRIVAALGIQEPDSDWSNLNDPSERAIEKIETLLAAQTPSASPGERE